MCNTTACSCTNSSREEKSRPALPSKTHFSKGNGTRPGPVKDQHPYSHNSGGTSQSWLSRRCGSARASLKNIMAGEPVNKRSASPNSTIPAGTAKRWFANCQWRHYSNWPSRCFRPALLWIFASAYANNWEYRTRCRGWKFKLSSGPFQNAAN